MNITAIDTHTHINHGSVYDTRTSEIYTADLDMLMRLLKATSIDKMLCSTFSSVLNTKEVEAENEYMFNLAREVDGLYQWVVIDPRNENTFSQAKHMLGSGKCVGIKLHPVNHKYTLEEYGDKLFSFAADFGAVVQIHPEKEADYILPFADKYPDVTFIMAHMGTINGKTYADAIEFAKHSNVYADTSGIASANNLVVEYVVNRVGSTHILFGTDTYSPAFQRGRIDYAMIPDSDKENILKNNALRLFGQFFD